MDDESLQSSSKSQKKEAPKEAHDTLSFSQEALKAEIIHFANSKNNKDAFDLDVLLNSMTNHAESMISNFSLKAIWKADLQFDSFLKSA